MCKIVIAGGGWAGCAAAVRAIKQGMNVVLIEKTDLLLGLGNVGGIMRNNGRFTGAEENIAMGAGELFEITDRLSTHKNIDFPGHKHASFYDVLKVEPEVRRLLKKLGVEIKFMCRAVDVIMDDTVTATDTDVDVGTATDKRRIKGLKVIQTGSHGDWGSRRDWVEEVIEGDIFIETTGSTGPMGNCAKYGNGCAMCVLRCPSFGPRVSLSEKAGNPDISGERAGGKLGAFSGSCKLEKSTLSPKLQKKLEKDGFAVIPLPEELINREKLSQKVCQQYALPAFAENIILIDTGYAKLMSPFFNLEQLRLVEGLENARFVDPYAGGKGNSVRYMATGERDNYMRAKGIENLFLGGEKAGFFVGHTEAITTGSLAGYNGAMMAKGRPLLKIPDELTTGDIIEFTNDQLSKPDGLKRRFTFAGGEYFKRMVEKDLYCCDVKKIKKRVELAGLTDIYNRQ